MILILLFVADAAMNIAMLFFVDDNTIFADVTRSYITVIHFITILLQRIEYLLCRIVTFFHPGVLMILFYEMKLYCSSIHCTVKYLLYMRKVYNNKDHDSIK